jgi:hypothetical protein
MAIWRDSSLIKLMRAAEPKKLDSMEKRRKLSPSDPAGWLALSGFRLAPAFASRLFPAFKGGADHKSRLEYLILTCKILQLFTVMLLLSHSYASRDHTE